jgi:hypothetical protein
MPRPMMFFVSVILFMPLATVLVTAQTSLAEPAADECKTKPGPSAPPGSHWYYRVDRTDQRHCWFLGPEGAKVRSQAREEPSRVSSPTQTARGENAFGTARVIPAPMEPAQRTPPQAASSESHRAAADFAAPSSDLPKSPDLDAREPTTISDNYTEANERTDAQQEMPLIWPVLTEAERAGLSVPTRESAPGPVFLVGALAIVLLCAGAIFKLARRQTQSYRCARRVVSRQPHRPRPSQEIRVDLSETPARLDDFVGRSAVGKRQRPSSINPTHDINASLRKIMDDLQRVAA